MNGTGTHHGDGGVSGNGNAYASGNGSGSEGGNRGTSGNDNGNSNGDGLAGRSGSGNGNGQTRHVLRVVVPRTGDDNACLRLLEQLHVLVERFPGQDEVHLVLHDRSGAQIALEGAGIAVRHSSELESQVRTLVGERNLEVLANAKRYGAT